MNPTADLKNDRQMGPVSIGRGTYWQNGKLATDVYPGSQLKIGRYCSIGPDVRMLAGGGHVMTLASTWPLDHFFKGAPSGGRTDPPPQITEIGSDVWIGAAAHIGGGVKIGHGAVIGSCAVVMKDVPPYAIVVGHPFRILRYRFDESIIESLLKIAWWEWPPEVIAARAESFYAPIEEFIATYLPQAGAPPVVAKPNAPLLPTVKAEFKLDAPTWKPTW